MGLKETTEKSKRPAQALSLIGAALALSACAQVHFGSSLANVSDSSVGSSTPVVLPAPSTCSVASVQRLTKIIFLVDTSGSNVLPTKADYAYACLPTDSFYAQCAPPTDPTKAFREGAIQSFFTAYEAKTNFNWEFIEFGGTQAHALVNQGGNDQIPVFATTPAPFQAAINSFMTETDVGATPYSATLHMATSAIAADPDLNSAADPQYAVVMLTDGFPTDYLTPTGGFNTAALNSDVAGLLAAAPGRVTLSTIYYGQINDPNAIALLQSMAQMGAGQYASVNNPNTGIKIDSVLPSSVCNPVPAH